MDHFKGIVNEAFELDAEDCINETLAQKTPEETVEETNKPKDNIVPNDIANIIIPNGKEESELKTKTDLDSNLETGALKDLPCNQPSDDLGNFVLDKQIICAIKMPTDSLENSSNRDLVNLEKDDVIMIVDSSLKNSEAEGVGKKETINIDATSTSIDNQNVYAATIELDTESCQNIPKGNYNIEKGSDDLQNFEKKHNNDFNFLDTDCSSFDSKLNTNECSVAERSSEDSAVENKRNLNSNMIDKDIIPSGIAEKCWNEVFDGKSLISNEEGNKDEHCDEIRYKFRGPVFRSFNEKKMRKRWERRSLSTAVDLNLKWQQKESAPELNRSQYSLVSCGELTAGAVQLWLGLPEEVKYDPALAPFRQLYEKEHGKDTISLKGRSQVTRNRLPLVSSAPHLNNNLQVVPEDDFKKKQEKEKLQELDTICPKKQTKVRIVLTMGLLAKVGLSRARHYTKMTLLLALWVFFTVVFLLYNEKEEVYKNSFVAPGEIKNYIINSSANDVSLLVKLTGPFLSEQAQEKLNGSERFSSRKMVVWFEPRSGNDHRNIGEEIPNSWTIALQSEDLDFSEGEARSSVLRILNESAATSGSYALCIQTTTDQIVPFKLTYTLNPIEMSVGVTYACLLLCGLYILIIFEVINRTMAAILISTTSLAALALAGERPSIPEVISWLDVETLLLLFSMMLLVAIMAETGMFDFLAVYTFEVTKGKLWPLITVLCVITAVLSTFLDNVTTVLLTTPVTIRLCEVMDLDPIPILMSMVLFSNIGGTATPVGDPPNVIIASNKAVVQAGINFTNFTLHMTLGILLVGLQTYFQLRFMFRDTNKLRTNVPREIQDLRHQISIWRRAADSLPQLSKDQQVVRERLERKVQKLTLQLQIKIKESNKRACPKETFQSTLMEMKAKYKIRDKVLLIKATVAITFVVFLFFLHAVPELNRVSLGWTALLGAILLLILADREDLEPILHRVEWSTLLFFAALFVMMEALSKLGLISFIGGITENIILKVDESARLAVALLLMLWVSGLTSAFVDNIPLTTMMVRIVTSLGSNPNLNLPMAPLIWALSFGACLGGNGTLIGASANVVCAGVAEQHGYKFTFLQFLRIGFPIMIGHLVVASAYLLLCHCAFQWH